jgi:ankyrin repeat protein
VKLLLDRGAYIEERETRSRLSALSWACARGQKNAAKMLLDHEANLLARDTQGSTSLHHACSYGNNSIVTILLDHGADINAKSKTGNTPLHIICERTGKKEVIRSLLKNRLSKQ